MSSSLQTIVDLKHVLSHFKVDLTYSNNCPKKEADGWTSSEAFPAENIVKTGQKSVRFDITLFGYPVDKKRGLTGFANCE
jgi:hypothetical protein